MTDIARKPITLVLENDTVIVTRKIRSLLDFKFQNTEIDVWLNFGTAFFSRKIEKTLKRFMRLQTGDNIVTKTNLDHLEQMELVIGLLLKHKDAGNKINVYVDCTPFFAQRVNDYLEQDQVFSVESEDAGFLKERKNFFDIAIKECIMHHHIYQICNDYYVDEEGWQKGLRKVYFDVKKNYCFC